MSSNGDDSLLLVRHLLRAISPPDALEAATDLLVRTTGATAAAAFLVKGEEILEEHWHGSAEPYRAGSRSSLTSDLHGKRVLELMVEDPGMRWLRISRGAGGHRQFMAALTFGDPESVGKDVSTTAETVVEIVARKLDVDQQLAAGRADLAKFKRWLELSNAQMLVLDRERQKFTAVVGQSDMMMFVIDEEGMANWANVAMKERLEKLGRDRVGSSI